ncbi:hypothetical protein OH492_27635 [Vibrio chagasii]|nr:hypothetical protein [Vibrio chagasii]
MLIESYWAAPLLFYAGVSQSRFQAFRHLRETGYHKNVCLFIAPLLLNLPTNELAAPLPAICRRKFTRPPPIVFRLRQHFAAKHLSTTCELFTG